MKKQHIGSNLPKKILFNLVFPALMGWAIYHLMTRALDFSNPIVAAAYWILAMACLVAAFISVSPTKFKLIGGEVLRLLACRLFPGSRFAKPPLSYTAARKFLAEKRYEEAIAEFQAILRHYPDEKEPYNQIIWIANLTGQTNIADKVSRNF